jgi:coronin-1B/1C/6
LSEYKSSDPQRGVAFMPKRGVNIHENEVMRAFKTVNDTYVEPISFIVPRRAEVFQSDIYPPVTGLKPGMTAGQWFGGKDALPPKYDLESAYEGSAPTEVASDYKPAAPLAVKEEAKPKEAPPAEPEPEPSAAALAAARPPPNMKEQGASMSNMASRFAEKEAASSDDDSSFEEVSQPTRAEARSEPKTEPKSEPKSAPPVKAASSSHGMWKVRSHSPIYPNYLTSSLQRDHSPPAASIVAASNAGTAQESSAIAEIKGLLVHTRTQLAAQSEMLVQLTSEVEGLRKEVKELKKE